MSNTKKDHNKKTYTSCYLTKHLFIAIEKSQRYHLGKLLTVIDATISDPVQRKATKDLITQVHYQGDEDIHTEIRYITHGLSQFLRDQRNEVSPEEVDEYNKYLASFFNKEAGAAVPLALVEDLEDSKLG